MGATTTVNLKVYLNDVDNATAPTNEAEGDALVLTTAFSDWNAVGSWVDGTTYDTPDIKSVVQEVIDRSGWLSSNALIVMISDNSSSSNAWRQFSTINHLSGVQKAELHVEWTTAGVGWEEKLSPDFLKLSDTPTTYSGSEGSYLKTTTSGIEFSDDELYTKSEVDTISGSLQTDMEAKTVWHLTEGSPSGSVGKEHDVAMNYNDGAMYKRLFGEGGGTVTAYPVVGGDDGNWASGIFNNSNNSLFLGLSDSVDYNTFIRVPNINIVKSATITNAFIRFTAYSSSSSTYVHNVNDLTPEMTSNTAPSPNVASSSTQLGGSYAAWYAFDHDASSRWIASIATGWLKFDFGAGNTKVANTYTLSATPSLGANAPNCPKTWTLQGSNNDSDWTTLDTKTNVPGWTDSEMRTYTFVNEIEYRYYKLDITATQGGAYVTVAELELFNNVVDVRISLNDVDNAVAPINETTADALVLTTNYSDWVDTSEWADGYTYDSVDFKGSVQEVIDRDGWSSGNSVTVIIKSNVGDSAYNKIVSSVNYLSGTEKPELHIAWEVSNVWEEKLSPDFLKLSDTPTTYSGVYGQYLKTTNSGIEFVEDLYTKSEVNTISGTLQAELDTKANIEWFLVEGAPAQPLGKKDDIAVNQETGNMYEKILDAPVTATWNPSDKSTGITLSNGNLTAVSTTEANKNVRSTLGKSSGKWYWEYTIDYVDGFTTRAWIGVGTSEAALGTILGYDIYGYSYFNASGNKANNGASVAYGDAFVTNDVIGIALDLDNGKIWWSRNGVWQASGDPAAGTNEAYSGLSDTFYAMVTLSDTDSQVTTNFGASSFSYSAPSGFTSGLLVGDVWEERLTPDFLKLSDTPTTYSGSDGKYLKTTTSGIDFVEDLYTKSEVDTISGTLQTDIDGKADTVHIHDDRYYTESEVDTISGTLQTSIDSMPVTLLELADTPTTYSGSVGEYLKTTSSGVIFSDIDSEYWESVDVFLDENYSNDKGLPTQVERGLFKGYSMPIWATPANQYEELVFRIRVPFRWDGVTNPTFMILVSTSATEDVGDKFKFQMEWESKGVSNVIPDTTAETLTDEVPVTDGTAYYSYLASASLDATKLISGDNLQFRVRRVTATDPQVSNEIIIWHWDSRWKMNKLGTVSE